MGGIYSLVTPNAAQTALAQRRAANGRVALMMLGDSMSGFTTYGYGRALMDRLASVRGDVTPVGTLTGTLAAPYPPYPLAHEGHSGYSIEQLTAAFASYVASAGAPDVVLVNAGTNNYATDTGATCATKTAALLVAITAAAPNAYVLVWSSKPSPTASPNDVNRAAHTALLPAVVAAAGARFSFVDAGSALDARGDGVVADSPAWTHPNDNGRALIAGALADALERTILPDRAGRAFPFAREAGDAQACLNISTAGSNLYKQNLAALEPGTGSFWVAFQVYFSSLSAAAASIYNYGYTPHAYELVLSQSGTGASLYVGSSTALTINGSTTMAGVWQARTWHDVIIHYEKATDTISLWRDGVLIGSATAGNPTFTAGDYTLLGYNSATLSGNGMVGLMRRFATGKGASVPTFAAMRDYARAWHTSQRLPPGLSSYYLLADAPSTWTSAIGGTSITTYSGSPLQSAAAAIPTPWDPVAGPGRAEHGIAQGTFTLNGVTEVDVAATSGTFPISATISLSLQTAGTTPGTGAPYFSKAQIADHFYVKSPTASCNDVYRWSAVW